MNHCCSCSRCKVRHQEGIYTCWNHGSEYVQECACLFCRTQSYIVGWEDTKKAPEGALNVARLAR